MDDEILFAEGSDPGLREMLCLSLGYSTCVTQESIEHAFVKGVSHTNRWTVKLAVWVSSQVQNLTVDTIVLVEQVGHRASRVSRGHEEFTANNRKSTSAHLDFNPVDVLLSRQH